MPSPSHVLSFRAFLSVILATVRESSEVKEGVLWIPRQAGNGRTMTRESVCCHSGAPPGIRSPLRARRSPNDREKEKTALIGPGGRQPRAERGRGLCERSEFRSPRARRRRPSEKARYRAAVLLGSFFSPKRRMNKKPLGFPVKRGMTFGKEMAGHKRAYKMHRQGSPQFFLHKKREQPCNRHGKRCRKRTEGNQAKAQSNPSRRSIVGVSRAVKIPLRVRPRLA